MPREPERAIPSARLGSELSLTLAAIGVLAAMVIFAILSIAIRREFGGLEQAEVRRETARAEAFLSRSHNVLERHVRDWGIWDESFRYLRDFNRRFEDENINAEAFSNAGVDAMVFLKTDGQHRAWFFEGATGRNHPELEPQLIADASRAGISYATANGREASAFTLIDGKLYEVAAVAVMQSDGSGPSPGRLVFFNRFNAADFAEAVQRQVALDNPPRTKVARTVVRPSSTDIEIPLRDIDGATIASLRFAVPRAQMAAGRHLLQLCLASVLALIAGILLLLNWRLGVLVVDPLERLAGRVRQFRQTAEPMNFDEQPRNHEVAVLNEEFEVMTRELAILQARSEAQSFALGRAQLASGMLHNLRNSLSPVAIALEDIERRAGSAVPPEADRALSEVAAPETEARRRMQIADFLEASFQDVATELTAIAGQARQGGNNLAVALKALSDQRDLTPVRNDESCDLTAQVGYAANVVRGRGDHPIAVQIEAPERLYARGNRVLLSQVLENLVVNAAESVAAGGQNKGLITIVAMLGPDDQHCRIVVSDNGQGFDEETGARLFDMGFSTRPWKAGGLGLHWCANVINAMGGKLELASNGPGRGAIATVTLERAAPPTA